MSLINDALKRASKANPPPPSSPNQVEAPLLPAEHRRPSASRLLWPLLGLVLASAVWFFVKGWQAGNVGNLSANQTPVLAREPVIINYPGTLKNSAAQVSTSQNQARTNVSAARPAPANSTGLAAVNSATSVPATAVEPAKPSFPPVRLQGIFYRPKNPSVMINSKTLLVGEKVAKVKVLAITRDSVTLEWNGETKVLTLE